MTIKLRDFEDYEIEDEYIDRGLGNYAIDEFSTHELIYELQNKGYKVLGLREQNVIWELYTTYLTMNRDFFEKKLKEYFQNELGVNV